MAEDMRVIDGVKVSVSTIKNALKKAGIELKKKEKTIIRDVDNLRVCRRHNGTYPVALGINSYGLGPEPKIGMTKEYTFMLMDIVEAKKLVKYLNEIIDDIEGE